MNNIAKCIASWEDESDCFESLEVHQDLIATESRKDDARLIWEKCIKHLRRMFENAPTDVNADCPNHRALYAALEWTWTLWERFPNQPPTCIVPEPDGGIIIERRGNSNGRDVICQLTFYNSGASERTDYIDKRITYMGDLISNRIGGR